MMSKFEVLIVEDEGNIFDMIKGEMDNEEYKFVRARSVAKAIDRYEESKFDCYVVDLRIGSLGLEEQEMVDFYNFEGYAWIKKYVLNSMRKEEILDFKKKTIICSKYVTLFQENYPMEEIKDFNFVNKEDNFESKLKECIIQICKK